MDRARLTITDVIYILVGLAGLAALYPPFKSVLEGTSAVLGPGQEMLFSTLLPVALLIMLAIIYVEARSGS